MEEEKVRAKREQRAQEEEWEGEEKSQEDERL